MRTSIQSARRPWLARSSLFASTLAIIGLLCALVLSQTVAADIWKKVDKNGMVHFSNSHMGKGSILFIRSKRKSQKRSGGGATSASFTRNKALHTPMIERTARQFGLEANLIHAVVHAESAYNAKAESNMGAVGLMQLMPATARRFGVSDRLDPAQNLRGGTKYLRELLLQFENVALALAAYNAGEGAVARYGNKIPPYPETRHYVKKVIRFYQALHKDS